jgi:hypothetical protein
MKSCCEHHADTLPHGCRQGRDCPEHTRSTQEAEYLWTRNLDQCARSGQMDSRQIAAHIAAGELDVGYESADPAHREPVRMAREPLQVSFAGPEPFDWGALVIWIGVVIAGVSLAALYIADPRDLSTLWPRLVALASF